MGNENSAHSVARTRVVIDLRLLVKMTATLKRLILPLSWVEKIITHHVSHSAQATACSFQLRCEKSSELSKQGFVVPGGGERIQAVILWGARRPVIGRLF